MAWPTSCRLLKCPVPESDQNSRGDNESEGSEKRRLPHEQWVRITFWSFFILTFSPCNPACLSKHQPNKGWKIGPEKGYSVWCIGCGHKLLWLAWRHWATQPVALLSFTERTRLLFCLQCIRLFLVYDKINRILNETIVKKVNILCVFNNKYFP